MSDNAFETTLDKEGVVITLKASKDYDAPWLVVRYASVSDALEAFKKEDGAELTELMRNVGGASKAFNAIYSNKELPPRTQGKPEGANNPSPQVTTGADPFGVDDAPPFGEQTITVPSCKHGEMKLITYKGAKGYVCDSGLPKNERCPGIKA